MHQSMPRCSTLDLAKSNKVAPLETTVSVFELPEGAVWRTRVEYVADC